MKVFANNLVTDSECSSVYEIKNDSFVVILNVKTSNSSEGIFGYSNLYYLPLAERQPPSTNITLVINGKEQPTEQSVLDDVEGMVSVEKYQSPCDEIVVIRARYFESGLESISELGYIYITQKNSQLKFIGQYDFIIGNEKEYQMFISDESLLPHNFKDLFSYLDFQQSDNELQLKITNFLNTKSQTNTFSLGDD
ncbi:hypothetical protein [Vibrio ouci]|uniref:Uncharacterized protein n=1 Tax=Vibrio ouci TaxID=2499078 RepID=A0A4Y8WAV8_9VIBR|nr:hypothetical protein [Vibrio ouci]TFH89538.1 hypothetical protein ELS82_21625 [Vibrio ouci]